MRFAIVMLAACSSPVSKPTTPSSPTGPAGPALGKPLAGPFATLDAYCATHKPNGDQPGCEVADASLDKSTAELGGTPIQELGIVYVSDQGFFNCAIGLRTAAGWFVTPATTEACKEPSYIELTAVSAGVTGDVVTIGLDVLWHTNTRSADDSAEASYTITTFCSATDHPACAPSFTSKCERQAPASDCSDRGYEATWTLAGTTLTLSSPSKNEMVPNGTHRLF